MESLWKPFSGKAALAEFMRSYPMSATLRMVRRIMTKSKMGRVRIQQCLKASAEKVYCTMGLPPAQAITMFYRQVELQKGLPFGVAIPNCRTKRAFADASAGRDVTLYDDIEDMFKKLGIRKMERRS